MRLLTLLSLTLPFLALGEELVIPVVESAIAQQNAKFKKYTAYDGPTGAAAKDIVASPTPQAQFRIANNIVLAAAAVAPDYWYEKIKHQGISAFNSNKAYKVYRNVKDFGAKGDGITDDTAAIQRAMSDQARCAPGSCPSSTTSPAVVYFPAGTYIISSSIIDYYYTQIIGNPNSMPVLKATAGFQGLGIIDGDPYEPGNPAGVLQFGSTNVFWRQIRNLIIDMTAIPAASGATGIHWPTAQATSLQNVVFKMSQAPGTQHQGLYIESGSGGFMNDLVFYGGLNAAVLGNQQFTMRNLTFYNAVTAIQQIWNWGWTYKSISINNCQTGIDLSNGGEGGQAVGSVTWLDSSFTNTKVAFKLSRSATSSPKAGGSLSILSTTLNNVPTAVLGPGNTVYLAGSTGKQTINGWKSGSRYNPTGPADTQGTWGPPNLPAVLLKNGKYYERSKPQYENLPITSFVSARSSGVKGDGVADDSTALQNAINTAANSGKVLFVDAGTYKVTKTIVIPKGSKIVGESYSVILASGSYFSNINSPQAVVEVGKPGDTGIVEWSDMIVSTQGAQAGAILIRWNLASTPGSPSGMWDVHTRIGGHAGSNLQQTQCPTTPQSAAVKQSCIGAYMSMHVTKSAAALYMENVWLWVADHDVENTLTQITVYAGRGLLIESTAGTIWLVGTSVEHHAIYQYQLSGTKNVMMGQIQTETPYYQPNPKAATPFPVNTALNDPNFATYCPAGSPATCAMAWGLRVVASSQIYILGAGLYSFFNNYDTSCNSPAAGAKCQTNIFTYDGAKTTGLFAYNLNTVGSVGMVQRDTTTLAKAADNYGNFPSCVGLFRSQA